MSPMPRSRSGVRSDRAQEPPRRRRLRAAPLAAILVLGIGAPVFAAGSPNPGQVVGLADVKAVSAGLQHSLFVKTDGSVWAVGNNASGQLGDGTRVTRCAPVQVRQSGGAALTSVSRIAAGAIHSLAVKTDGTVWAWGNNFYGQLGVNGIPDSVYAVQVQVPVITTAVDVAAGNFHSVAHLLGGAYQAWGLNDYGQHGDGSTTDATQYGAGGRHTLALRGNNNGKVRAWGRGWDGQLGGQPLCANSTAPVGMIDQATGSAFTGGGFVSGGVNFSLVTTTGGKVWTTGQNGRGQLGVGAGTISTCALVKIPNLTNVTRTVAGGGGEHAVALRSDGTLRSWGRNDYGQLGDGSNVDRFSPVGVVDVSGALVPNFVEISANHLHSLGVRYVNGARTAWSWGDNSFCQLGR